MRRWWSTFVWSLCATVLCGLAAVPYLWRKVDDQIRLGVLAIFAQRYPDYRVEIRSAELVRGEGIRVHDLAILAPLAGGKTRELVTVDELTFRCDTCLKDLCAKTPRLESFLARRVRIRATCDGDGAWDVAQLWPPPQIDELPLPGRVEQAIIDVYSPSLPDRPLATMRDVAIEVVHKRPPGRQKSKASPVTVIRGGAVGDRLQQIEFTATIERGSGAWTFAGEFQGLELSPELQAALPKTLAGKLAPVASLRAQVNASFQIRSHRKPGAPPTFKIQGDVSRGQVDDPRLPYPLLDLKATFLATHEGFEINQLAAQNGPTRIELSARQGGYGPDATMYVTAAAERLLLDETLRQFLPPPARARYDEFRPRGEIDLSAEIAIRNDDWTPKVSVTCRGIGLTYAGFPQPVEDLWGTVRIDGQRLSVELSSRDEECPLELRGELTRLGQEPLGWWEVSAEQLTLDERLATALGNDFGEMIHNLRATASMAVSGRWEHTDDEQPAHTRLDARVTGGSLRYRGFPYPIEQIHGRIEMRDGHWRIENLQGVNDTGRIACQGDYAPPPAGSRVGVLRLSITAIEMPLERDLKDALSTQMAAAWDSLRPKGAVDLATELVYRFHDDSGQPPLSVIARISPSGETVSLEPVMFPWRLEKLKGLVEYRDGKAVLRRMRAEHDRVTLAAQGLFTHAEDGGWSLQLDDLAIERLKPDRELLSALPQKLRHALEPLELDGMLHVAGALSFAGDSQDPTSSSVQWDLRIETNGGSVRGFGIEGIHGGVQVTGEDVDGRMNARGELDIDSLIWRNMQFTDVAGPVQLDQRQVTFGAPRGRPTGSSRPRHITARVCGGGVEGDARVLISNPLRYDVRVGVENLDLATWAREVAPGEQSFTGKAFAQAEFNGQGRGMTHLFGRGNVQLRDADIYRLPVMLALLKVLKLRVPVTTAFSRSDVDFRIEGEHTYFDQINFEGDAVSLSGTGEMNLNQEVRLEFHASILPQDRVSLPVIREILGQAAKQTMTIHVGGTWHEPETRFEPFPALNDALKQLQGDRSGAPGSARSGSRILGRGLR